MNLENVLFGMPLLSGIVFVIIGYITYRFPPKKINLLYGYRTTLSMKNQEHWDFAQIYASLQMIYLGFGLVLISVLGILFKIDEGLGVIIGTIELIIVAIILFYNTEKAIKQKFKDEE